MRKVELLPTQDCEMGYIAILQSLYDFDHYNLKVIVFAHLKFFVVHQSFGCS